MSCTHHGLLNTKVCYSMWMYARKFRLFVVCFAYSENVFFLYIYIYTSCMRKALWQRGCSSVCRGYTSVCYRNMGIFYCISLLFLQRFVSTLWFETVRDAEELVARGQWRIRCKYARVFRRSSLSYGIIWLWDRWREPVNKTRMYCSSGEMVE